MTVEELQVLVTARTQGLQQQMNKLTIGLRETQRQSNEMSNSMTKAFSKLKAGLVALGIGKYLKDSFNLAKTYEASVGQVNRLFGLYSGALDKWIQKNATTFGMARADAMKYASTYGNLLAGFIKDTSTMEKYTEQLLQSSAIIASNTGRTIEDVNERIRSGLLGNTESIEDLGVNVNVALLETTNAFKALANGKSWEQLNFATQQQIRLMAILEQTSDKFGTSIQQNTNYQMMRLTANLKNIALNIGNAFMPIVNVVLPVLNAMSVALSNVTAKIAEFMNALFGTNFGAGAGDVAQVGVNAGNAASGYDAMADSATDAGKAAEKAGKTAKGALAGFDELNTLAKEGASGASGGAGGIGNSATVGMSPITNNAISSPINSSMTDAASKFAKAIEPTIEALNRLKKALVPFGNFAWKALMDFYDLCLVPIGKWTFGEGLPRFIDAVSNGLEPINWERINEALREVYTAITPFAITVGDGLVWFFENALIPLSSWTINEVVPRFLFNLSETIKTLDFVVDGSLGLIKQLFTEFLIPIAEYAEPKIIAYMDNFNKKFKELSELIRGSKVFKDLETIFSVIYDILKPIIGYVIDLASKLANFKLSQDFINIKYTFKDIEDVIGAVAAILKGDFSDAWEHLKGLLGGNEIDKSKEQVAALKEMFGELSSKVSQVAQEWSNKTKEMFDNWSKNINKWWTDNVNPWFTKEKWDGILFNIGASLATALANFVNTWNVEIPKWWSTNVSPWFTIEKWKSIFNNINTSMSQKFSEFSTKWGADISSWWNTKVSPWFTVAKWNTLGTNIKDGLVGGFKGAVNGIAGLLNKILDGFESAINGVVTGINKMIEGYNSIARKTHLPTMGSINRVYMPNVPMLARGGIVDGATFMGNYVAGEAGKEMIVPLEDTAFVDKLASALGNAVFQAMQTSKSMGGQDGQNLSLEMDGTIFARTMAPIMIKEFRRLGVSI